MRSCPHLVAGCLLPFLVTVLGGCDLFSATQRLGCDDFGDDLKLEHDPALEVDYVIDCLAEIDGIELEIYDGAVVEFEADTGLKIGPSARVTVVSIDGPSVILRGTEQKPGHWKGLRFEIDSLGDSKLQNVHISDVGDPTDPDFPGAVTVVGYINMLQTQLERVAGVGIYVEEGGFIGDFSANTITDCSGYPLHIDPANMSHLDIDNSYSGNGTDRVLVDGGVISSDAIILDPGVPFELSGDIDISGSMNLSGAVQFLAADDVRLYFTGGLSTDWDTHASFSALTEQPGAWHGLVFNVNTDTPESPIQLFNITVEYGGGGALLPGNISVERGRFDLQDCRINYSAACGVAYDQSASEYRDLGNNTFIDNSGGSVCPN